jgi:hypothetical protein
LGGQVERKNGDDVGLEIPLSSHHIGIGTKLCCRFEFSVVHYIFYIKSTQVNSLVVHNKNKQQVPLHVAAKSYPLTLRITQILVLFLGKMSVLWLQELKPICFHSYFHLQRQKTVFVPLEGRETTVW